MDQSYAADTIRRLTPAPRHVSASPPPSGENPPPVSQPSAAPTRLPWRRVGVVALCGVILAFLCWNFVARLYGPTIGTVEYDTWDRAPAFAYAIAMLAFSFAFGLLLRDRWLPLLLAAAATFAWCFISFVSFMFDGLNAIWVAMWSIMSLSYFFISGFPAILLSSWLGRWTYRALRRLLSRQA